MEIGIDRYRYRDIDILYFAILTPTNRPERSNTPPPSIPGKQFASVSNNAGYLFTGEFAEAGNGGEVLAGILGKGDTKVYWISVEGVVEVEGVEE